MSEEVSMVFCHRLGGRDFGFAFVLRVIYTPSNFALRWLWEFVFPNV